MSVQVHTSETIDVTFDTRRCIHARKCVLGLPQVFQTERGADWIQPQEAPVADLVAVIEKCPSGALQYTRKDGGPAESAPPVNTIRVHENGPLEVHADLDLQGAMGTYRATLCRCGMSKIKPFCNGAHKARFEATGEVAPVEGEALSARDGRLEVAPAKNGPLRVSGNVELICGASGTTITTTTSTALCRCGQSANKPFCDGSHADLGFRADGV